MMEYTLGYLFSSDKNYVCLILKSRPPWQKNNWNAVGGKLEEKPIMSGLLSDVLMIYHDGNNYRAGTNSELETPHECMVREFREETGVELYDWVQFATIIGDDYKLHCLKAFNDDALNNVRWTTDEPVGIHNVNYLPDNLVAHNRWTIPMALTEGRYSINDASTNKNNGMGMGLS
jgi:8-oxo-dGTP pyrophosphatase MutT (NUDIX family)